MNGVACNWFSMIVVAVISICWFVWVYKHPEVCFCGINRSHSHILDNTSSNNNNNNNNNNNSLQTQSSHLEILLQNIELVFFMADLFYLYDNYICIDSLCTSHPAIGRSSSILTSCCGHCGCHVRGPGQSYVPGGDQIADYWLLPY